MKLLLLTALGAVLAHAQPQPLTVLPRNGQSGVPRNARILVRFSLASPTGDAIRLTQAGRVVEGRQEQRGHWVTFTPSAPLAPRTVYDLSVNIQLNQPYAGRFTTGDEIDNTPPVVVSDRPGERRDGSPPAIEIRFSKPMDPVSLSDALLTEVFGSGPFSTNEIDLSADFTTLTVGSPFQLSYGRVYSVNFRDTPPPLDWAGNRLAPLPAGLLISTYPQAPRAAPTLIQSIPADGEADVPTNSSVLLEFSANLIGDEAALARGIDWRDQDDQPIAFRVDRGVQGLSRRYLVIRPAQLLRSNRGYRVRVTGLSDDFANSQAGPVTLEFKTAALPELRAFALVSQPTLNTRPPHPSNLRIRWTFSRPVAFVTSTASATPTQLAFQVSPDRLAVEATGAQPGQYFGQLSVFDRVELRAQTFFYDLTLANDPDNTPPSIRYTIPSELEELPANARLRVVFSEPVVPLDEPMLLRDGAPTPVTVNAIPESITITPRLPLEIGGVYRFRVPAVRDLAGNVLPAREIGFQAGPAPSGPLQLVRSTPDPLAREVGRNEPLILEFNRPIDPGSIGNVLISAGSTGLGAALNRWTVNGSTATYSPDPRWPRASVISWSFERVLDLAGNAVTPAPVTRFFTRDEAAEAPPLRIVSTSLADGAVLPASGPTEVEILLRVSTPVNPITTSNAVLLYEGDRISSFLSSASYDAAERAIRVRMTALPGGSYSIQLTSSILSFEGEPMEPFVLNFSRARGEQRAGFEPGIAETEPGSDQRSRLESGMPIVLYFGPGMRRALVEEGLSILVRRGTAAFAREAFGQEWAPDESAVTLRPLSPLAPGDSLTVLLSLLPWDINQVYAYPFSIEQTFFPPNPGTWPVTRVSGGADGAPLDAVFDVEFGRDVPDSVLATAAAYFWEGSFNQMRPTSDLRISRISSRVLRLTPLAPLAGGVVANYSLRFGSEIVVSRSVRTGSRNARVAPGGAFTLPVDGAAGVPLNFDPRVAFPVAVSPPTGTIAIETGGVRLPLSFVWTNGGKVATFRRQGLWRANTRYAIVIENFQDLTGRPLPNQRVEFTTGGSTERGVVPRLLFFEPKGGPVSRNADIRAYFDRPLIYSRADHSIYDWFAFDASRNATGGWIEYLDGGRTLRFVPDGPLPENSTISFWDLGQHQTLVVRAGDARDPAPELTLVTPSRDATNVPPDATIQFRFSTLVRQSSLTGATLWANGEKLEAIAQLAEDGITVTLRPRRVLPLNAAVEVRLAGIANSEGVAISGGAGWTFRTGPAFSRPTTLTTRWNPEAGVVEFSAPVNPLTVSAASCSLFERNIYRVAVVRAELSADARRIRCVPTAPLRPESEYRLQIVNVLSWTGQPIAGEFIVIQLGNAAAFSDRQGPRLLSILPREGTELNVLHGVVITFDEVARVTAENVELSLDGRPLAVSLFPGGHLSSGLSHTLRPVMGWLPNRTYSLRLAGVTDAFGNLAAPLELAIRTAALTVEAPEFLRSLGATPATNSVGVSLNTPVVFNFNRPVAPAIDQPAYSFFTGEGPFNSDARITLAANSISVQPMPGWPAAANLFVRVPVRDAAGGALVASTNFTTAAPVDQTPPRLVSVSPAQGSRVPSGSTRFVLHFDEAVTPRQPLELTAPGLGQLRVDSIWRPAAGDGRVLTWDLQLPASASITLRIQGITDLSGNMMAPEIITFSTLPEEESIVTPRLLSVAPQSPQGLTGSDPIQLRFSQPMDRNALASALSLIQAGQPVEYTLGAAGNSLNWTLTPAVPWRGEGSITLIVTQAAYSEAGLLLNHSSEHRFFVMPPPPSGAPSLAAYLASDRVIDLLFDRPITEIPAEPFGLRMGHQRVPGVLSRMSERWLQIVLDQPLQPETEYHLMLGPALEMPLQLDPPAAEQRESKEFRGWRLNQVQHRFALASLSCGPGVEVLVPAAGRETDQVFVIGKAVEPALDCIAADQKAAPRHVRLKREIIP